MARSWSFQKADGSSVALSNRPTMWVGEGATGLDAPPYEFAVQQQPGVDGSAYLGGRAKSRTVNIPFVIEAFTRAQLRQLIQSTMNTLEPLDSNSGGPGKLFINDPINGVRYLNCYYTGGLEGGDTEENDGKIWKSLVLSFDSTDPYWYDDASANLNWGGSASARRFFPIFPLTLGGSTLNSGSGITYFNYVTNPSYENNITDGQVWAQTTETGKATTTTTLDNTASMFGHKSQLFSSTATGTYTNWLQVTGLTVGNVYTASIYVFLRNNMPPIQFSIDDGTQQVFAPASATAQNIWVRLAVSFTAGATSVNLRITMQGGQFPIGASYNIDGVMLSNAPYANDYIDGDQVNCSWTGTPHNSTSSRDPNYEPTPMDVSGDVPAFPIWTFTGPATSIILSNETGDKFELDYALPASRVVTVDTRPGLQQVVLDDGTSLWQYLSGDDLFWLHPGRNYIKATINNAGTASAIGLQYTPRYRTSP